MIRNKNATENGTKTVTEAQVAERIGQSVPSVYSWASSKKQVKPYQIANMLFKAQESAVRKAQTSAVAPIVEFLRLDQVHEKENGAREVFNYNTPHTYLKGLRDELNKHCGIYIFHDSSGQALYVGKARLQKLWAEINFAFNRKRTTQVIKRVNHPARNVSFRTAEEITRKIAVTRVPLYDLARYVSAYKVAD